MAIRISQERQDKIVELYAAGHSRLKVAEMAETSIVTVNKVLEAHGVELRPTHTTFFDEAGVDEASIVAGYAEGISSAALAANAGTTIHTVRKVLRKHGVPLRDDRGRARKFGVGELALMRELAAAGMSQNEIAASFKSSVLTIRKALGRLPATFTPPVSRRESRGADRPCAACGVLFSPRHNRSRFCSLACRDTGQKGESSPNWKGGRIKTQQGYYVVYMPDHPAAQSNGYMPEHRVVMEKKLGRMLEDHETVHHINGQRGDNREENLQLRSGRHGKGACYRCLDCGSTNVVAVQLEEEVHA